MKTIGLVAEIRAHRSASTGAGTVTMKTLPINAVRDKPKVTTVTASPSSLPLHQLDRYA